MNRGLRLTVVLAVLSLSAASAHEAPVRHWIDASGVLHLSNAPLPPTTADAHQWTDRSGTPSFSDRSPAELARERARRDHLVRCPRGMATTGEMVQALAGKRVVLLSARWCPVAAEVRAFLRSRKIHFREYDIEHQARGRALYARLGTRVVPVILVGRQYMYGFYRAGLARMLRHRHGK